LKQAVKQAIKEVVAENSEAIKEMLAEMLEDAALLRRMEEGKTSEFVSRDEVMGLLEPKN
jgi:hypothetical protein